jgi:hypothetical protein
VAGGAVHLRGMVLLVAGGAGSHRRLGLERHPRRMTVDAPQPGVFLVPE